MSYNVNMVAEDIARSFNSGEITYLPGILESLVMAMDIPEAKRVIVVIHRLYSKRLANALYNLWKARDVDRYGVAVLR